MYVVKVPGINGLGKTKGCEGAGNAIIAELKNIYSNEIGKEINIGKLDLEEIHLDNSNLEITNKLIYENALETFEENPKVVFLGGDHSVSFGLSRAFLDFCNNSGKEPCLIVFDAHPDCMEPVDDDFPTHEEWLRGLVEKGFPAKNILLVGVRNSEKSELKFLKENGINFVSMNTLLNDLEGVCDGIMEFARNKELYVSVDIDVVDPAFAPSTGHREVGGLLSRELIYLISRINKIKTLRAVDIVEINSEKDKEFENLTVKLGAKILSELV